MTAKELAEKMLQILCLDNEISRYDISEAGLNELAKQLEPAMCCNWVEGTIELFVAGNEDERCVMTDILPNGYKIANLLDDIFEGKYTV